MMHSLRHALLHAHSGPGLLFDVAVAWPCCTTYLASGMHDLVYDTLKQQFHLSYRVHESVCEG